MFYTEDYKQMHVVRFITNDDGDAEDDQFWHWVDAGNYQGRAKFCTQEFFGTGESPLSYKEKDGKITCPNCIRLLSVYRAAAEKAKINAA